MEILEFKEFCSQFLVNEADQPDIAPPPSPATDVPPATTTPQVTTPTPAPSDLGTAPSTLPEDPNAQPVSPTEPPALKFIFIQDANIKQWHGEHDKEGGIKRFTVYSIEPEELTKWLEVHKEDEDEDLVKAALSGKRPMPASIYSDFKKEVVSGKLGADKGVIDITFDSDTDLDNPSTSDLDVVFLRSEK